MLNQFKKSFDYELKKLVDNFLKFPWDNPQHYAGWLAQTYYFVNYSTRLLSLCASRLDIDQNETHKRFLKHVGEEAEHEKMAIKDLKTLNFRVEDFAELPETSALYQSQYFWIEQKPAVSFLGYIFALEGLAVSAGPIVYEKVKKSYGDKACGFVRVHSQEDPDHLEKAFEAIKGLSDEHIKLVEKNFRLSCDLYSNMLRAIPVAGDIRKSA